MGHSNAISWVQAAIPMAGPLFQWGQDDHCQRPQRRKEVDTTDNRAPRKGSYRASRMVSTAKWILFNLLHNSKKRWRCSTYSRRFCHFDGFAISHATHIGCPSSNQPTAMVHHDRSEGCLLSCADRTTIQTISPLCISGSGVPVSRITIWPVSVPASVHEVYVGSIISNSSSGSTVTVQCGNTERSGKLDFRSNIERHRCFGVESGAASSGALWTGIAESSCSYKDRQYFSGISYQSSGRHEVQSLAEVDMGHSDVGFPSIGKHQGDVCTRGFECGGRFLVPSQTLTGRVVAQSGGSSDDLASIWQSNCGSLRFGGVNTLPSVVLMDRKVQPIGSGCTSTHLARSTTLCLSSNSPNSANSPQNTERTLQGALSGTKLAGETTVPIVIQTSQGGTLESSQETGSSPAVAGTDLASKSRHTTALCLAADEPELLFGACDMNVKNTILNSRAPSTRNMYACRWKLFTEWCTQRRVIPEQCSVPLVLGFVQSLLENNRAPSTLRVYVATISAQHAFVNGQPLGSHNLVTRFLKGAQRLRPAQTVRCPPWDFSLVLKSLTQHPFEPMEQGDLKWISWKTAFLLAILQLNVLVSSMHCQSVNPVYVGMQINQW